MPPRPWRSAAAKCGSVAPRRGVRRGSRDLRVRLGGHAADPSCAIVRDAPPDLWAQPSRARRDQARRGQRYGRDGVGRSVALFTQALRDRFSAGDLSVAVGSSVEPDARGAYFVRSQWTEPDRSLRIDLVMSPIGGLWRWTAARQYFTRADLGSPI